MKKSSLLVATLVCTVGLSNVLVAQSKFQVSSEMDVSISSASECPECLAGVSYMLRTAGNGHVGSLPFTFEVESMTAIKQIFHSAGHLGIYGELARGGDELIMIDLQSQSAVLRIRGYDMQFSDSGRYVTYSEWYPRMRPELSAGGVYLYDLSMTLAENMLDENFVYDEDVIVPYGRSVSPTAESTGTADVVTGARVPGTTAWSRGESLLSFIYGINSRYQLIAVDLSSGIGAIRLCEFPLFSQVVTGEAADRYTPSDIEITSESSVRINFYPNDIGAMRVEFDFDMERCFATDRSSATLKVVN